MGRQAAIQKRMVWEGRIEATDSGLHIDDLIESKTGQIVSKKKHLQGLAQMQRLKEEGRWQPPYGTEAKTTAEGVEEEERHRGQDSETRSIETESTQ